MLQVNQVCTLESLSETEEEQRMFNGHIPSTHRLTEKTVKP